MTRNIATRRVGENLAEDAAFCRRVVFVVLVCFSIALGLIVKPSWSDEFFGAMSQRLTNCRADAAKAFDSASSGLATSKDTAPILGNYKK